MDEPATAQVIHQRLTARLGALPAEAHHLMMLNFFEIANLLEVANLFPRLVIVVDTNQVLSYALAVARHRSHPLDQLLVDEYVVMCSPCDLVFEVEEHLDEFAAREGVPPPALRAAWEGKIRPRIDIQSYVSRMAMDEARSLVGRRDPKDAPFMALYLDLGADAMLTRDHALRDAVGEFAWTPGRAKWGAIRVRAGVVSLFLIHPIGSTAASALANLAWVVLDSLWWAIESVTSALEEGIDAASKWLSGLPDWAQALLAIGAVVALAKYGEEVAATLKVIGEKLVQVAAWILAFLRKLFEWIGRWLRTLSALLSLLLSDVWAGANELIRPRYGSGNSGSVG